MTVHGILTDLSPIQSVGQSVSLSVRKVYCGKTVEWIRMPFGMVWGQSSDRYIRWGGDQSPKGKRQFWSEFGHPIVTNGDFVA